MDIRNIILHARHREYMSGIDRDNLRVKATGEVFTPTELVRNILDRLPQEEFDITDENTFMDPTCGDGQFLSEVLIRKLERVSNKKGSQEITDCEFEAALRSIYGVDLRMDNVYLCRERLLCGQTQFEHIVQSNIVQADGLKYNYSFKPTTAKRLKQEKKILKGQLDADNDNRLRKLFPGLLN
jgi:hypothetical protein